MKSIHHTLISSCLIWLLLFYHNDEKSNVGINNSEIDIDHQLIDVSIDWDNKQLLGNTSILMSILSPTDSIVLDASKLLIESVVLENGQSLNFKTDEHNNKLKIGLNKEYSKNDRLKLSIKYRTGHINQSDPNNIWGSFGKGLRFFRPTMTDKDRRLQVWAIGEPDINSYWFPGINNPMDLRTTELIGTVKDSMMVISNGVLVSTKKNEDGTTSYHWQSNIPHSNQNISVIVGSYSNFQQQYKDVTINNYGYPDETEGTSASVVMLPEIMEFYSDFTGLPYPYPAYTQIFVQDFAGWKGGVMNAIITENMVDDKTTHDDFLYLWDVVEGEALAYQWFGNTIKPKAYKEIWLSKAFCRHLASLFNQHKNGNEEFLLYQLSPDLSTYLSDWNAGIPIVIVPDKVDGLEAFVNGNTPYIKGALVLNMLRKQMGESKWKEAIRRYVDRSSGELVSTEDFIEVINSVNGEPLGWFFDQWVYGIGHPVFQVEGKYDPETNEYELIVVQTQKVDSVFNGKRIPFFQGKMKLEINEQIHDIFINPQKKNVFKFILNQAPDLVNFDFEDAWIKEVTFLKTDIQFLEELTRSKDVLHRVACMQELAKSVNNPSTNTSIRTSVLNALRKVAQVDGYWRTRLIALWQLQGIANTKMKNGKADLEQETIDMLIALIRNEKSWLKANAISLLGLTCDKQYIPIYLEGLDDYSDRVVFMSAIALGKTKDPKAFEALIKLPGKPSWKNQSLISALYGLKELKDPRALELSLKSLTASEMPHWNLATPIWDHRLAAAHALVAIEKSNLGHIAIQGQLQNAVEEGNVNDIFYNALLISILKAPEGKEMLNELGIYFKGNEEALQAIENLKSVYN